jgi:hypothetical protein
MSKPYFRQVPNFEYISRNKEEKQISNYDNVKNLFKRGKLREDIFGDLSFFTKYQVVGDERPDNVAYKFYNESTLDWVVLLSNNILNIQTEWPMTQYTFDKYLLEKYGDYNTLYNGAHHYEVIEDIKTTQGITIIPKGTKVDSGYSVTYYDSGLQTEVTKSNISNVITNYDYENKIQEDKRGIFILKARYLNVLFNDMDNIMVYKKGGDQYVNSTLKKGNNIRLFE